MKILVLNYEFPPLGGGASPVTYELSKELILQGNEVDVITMHYKGLPLHEKKDGINIFRVKSIRKKKETCETHEMLSYIISAKRFLKKLLKKKKYDICHCHFIIPTGLLALWLKKKFNLNYMITAHGSDVPGFNADRFTIQHKFTGPMLKLITKEAKLITTPSKFLKDLIVKNINKNLKQKIVVLPNGSKDFLDKKYKKTNIIYSCGRLLKRKGFQYLIQAFNKVNNKEWQLVIIGDGPYKNELKRLARDNPNIKFTGWINHKDKLFVDTVNQAKIFALLSLSESQGIVYLEGMSTGCAVISSNNTACAETVTSEIGFLVKRENVAEIAIVLKKLMDDKSLLTRLMKNSRKRYEDNFLWPNVVKKYLRLYKGE